MLDARRRDVEALHLPAVGQQALGDREADARAAARDDGDT
jgi:hypothetical protein